MAQPALYVAVGRRQPRLARQSIQVPAPDQAAAVHVCWKTDCVHLTERELQYIEAVARGQTNKQIARKLGLAEISVKNALTRLFDRLSPWDIHDRTQLAIWAWRAGIIR